MNLPLAVLLALSQAPSPAPATGSAAAVGPVVLMETSLGSIRIGLYQEKAPLTVDNFLKYVQARHFDGTVFHRVVPTFVIQGGGLTADLKEKPTRPAIRNEARNGLRNRRGTLSMARTNAPDSATCQFFVNLKDNHSLDFGIAGAGYAVFAEVLEGMDVVDKIAAQPTTSKGGFRDVPVTPVVIRSVKLAK
jgi:cyclophilin family peptidyl-prolyl cis-trans isomerase